MFSALPNASSLHSFTFIDYSRHKARTSLLVCAPFIGSLNHPEFAILHYFDFLARVILTAVVLAAKFFDDRYYSNRFYAAVGGVRTKELNALEADFLRLISEALLSEELIIVYFF